jgi:hypothetical protein
MINQSVFKATEQLPDHQKILKALLNYFCEIDNVIGAFVSGSVAACRMDHNSDLDIGIVISDNAARDKVWANRWNWDIADWFHRFDADHIKGVFVIYLYYPHIKADISLYTMDNLPGVDGAPFALAYDKTGRLEPWCSEINREYESKPRSCQIDIKSVIHDDERIWAWLFFCYQHISRGEYYSIASEFYMLRNIIEKWHAILGGQTRFNIRRAEFREDPEYLSRLTALFPKPNKTSLKKACLELISMHLETRKKLSLKYKIQWKTQDSAIDIVSKFIKDL